MTGIPTPRDQAIAALTKALALAGGDNTALFSGELDALAGKAAEACPDVEHDLQVRLLIGSLHLLRSMRMIDLGSASTEAVRIEVGLVGEWLGPVRDNAPDLLPEPVREALGLLSGLLDPQVPEAAALDAKIRADRRLLADVEPGHPAYLPHLTSLAIDLRMKYDQTQDLLVLREAVVLGRAVVASIPPDDPDFDLHWSVLSVPLRLLSERTGDLEVMREAVRLGEYIRTVVPGKYDAHYALQLLRLFEHTGDLEIAHQATELFRQIVAATDRSDPEHGGNLSNLSLTLRSVYLRTGDKAALLAAAQAGRDAVSALPSDDLVYAPCLSNLSVTLLRLFERTGDADVLREAERAGREAVAALAGRPDRAMGLANLGVLLVKVAEQSGDLAMLREAAALGREAIELAPAGDQARAIGWAALGLALFKLGALTGDPTTLQEAEDASRAGLAGLAPTSPERGFYLDILGFVLRLRYEHTQNLAVVREAVAAHREAVAAVSPGQPQRGVFVTNLGVALICLFDATGDVAVVREAVAMGREAVAATPPEDTYYAGRAMNLTVNLLLAAERVEELAVLREAVRIAKDAVAALPPEHPDQARFLSNLGNALAALFNRTGDIATLRSAVATSAAAVLATPPEQVLQRGVALTNLAQLQLRCYLRTREPAALAEAVRASGDAVAIMPPEHRSRARTAGARSHVLLYQFEHTGEVAALREAVRVGREALAGLPPGHFDHTAVLVHLAVAHQRLAEPAAARRLFTAAAAVETASPTYRIHAARNAAALDLAAGELHKATASIELALRLLPQLASRDLARADREFGVAATAGLASTAAAVFIALDQRDRAVEVLEQTRGLVLASTLDIRDDRADLRHHSPDLAAEFDVLCRALDAADHDESLTGDRRAELNQDWHDLLARIRARPDHAGFLRPPSIDQLRLAGPIVYVTVHDRKGHALIVDGERPVRVVELTELTELAAHVQVAALRDARSRSGIPSQYQILRVLEWLWHTIAEPVLRELEYDGPPTGEWPRIWWCPVGVVTFLPLHAAGLHLTTPHTDTVLDRVISSYTPTIRALGYARDRHPGDESMVVIAVPDAPETTRLTSVEKEARLLKELVPTATVLPAAGATMTRDMATEAMRRHQIVHFACHGIADLADPTASRLLLHDHRTEPLTVHTVTGLRLTDARLAYLSACSTTDTNSRQADEATHLTAAFQLAGYRDVVGTLWPIDDEIAALIARDFHARRGDPAAALHHTLRACREEHTDHPALWAAYIHSGA